jgi:TRAP-type transport system small permease protein
MDDPAADMSAADPAPARQPERTPLARAAFVLGATGLLAATVTDSLAVFGRHVGIGFLGSIEIVQAAVVLAASGAVVTATIARGHAAVHVLTERVSPAGARRLAVVAAMLSALVFAVMTAGSLWLVAEGWDGHERTELIGIPLRWFRLVWTAATLIVMLLFVAQLRGRTVR